MTLDLTFAPVEVSPAQILEKAALFQGQPFALDGHFAHWNDGVLTAKVDCLRYLFFVWRECGLWPQSWGDTLPRELRAIRFEDGNRLRALADFPILREILDRNFEPIVLENRALGDVLLFHWPQRVTAHHAGIAAPGDAIWHAAIKGAVGLHDLDALWLSRLAGTWRLKRAGARSEL